MKNAMPAQRLVIKVGSSLVTRGGQGVDQQALNHWADQVAALRARAAAAPVSYTHLTLPTICSV